IAVGRTLGWQYIKSTAFELKKQDNVYRFSGHGSGHGVGLCVIGSARLAERGVSASKILARYFPGLEVSGEAARAITTDAADAAPRGAPARAAAAARPQPAPLPDVALSLPDEDVGARSVIEREVLRDRDDLARRLGVASPPRVTVRFHPTTDDYERATGRAW